MTAPVSCLRDLLAPYSEDAFLRDDWNKAIRYVKGEPGRFAGLMAWRDLNRILTQHELDDPRLRIMKAGESVSEPPFVSHWRNRDAPSVTSIRIDAEALSAHLRDGGTLVLDRVDRLHEPVGALSRALERQFGGDIRTNLYAGWRTTQGLDLHWDDHDVMILQVHGRKHWRVYAPTRLHPLARDIALSPGPSVPPIWDDYLEAGDILYIPRGFWHVAVPLDEPTLHLTLGFPTITAQDLFAWMGRKLRGSEIARMDLPRIASRPAQRKRVAELKQAFDALWHDSLIEEYFEHKDRSADRRAALSLPFAALEKPFAEQREGVLIEWRTARDCTIVSEADGTLRFKAHGKQFEYHAAARGILARLMAGGQHDVAALCNAFAGPVTADQIAELLGGLLHDGLIVATEGVADPSIADPSD